MVLALTPGTSREASPAISPDGKFVAYLASEGGRTDVWVKFVGGGPGVNLTAGSGLEIQSQATIGGLEISPDGSSIAVRAGPPDEPNAERGVWLIPAPLGGPPRKLVDRAGGLRWSADGSRIVYMRPDPASGDAILVARSDGAEERVLVPPTRGLHLHEPAWSHDGAWIYFNRGLMGNNDAPTEIWRVPSGGGAAERVVETQGVARDPLLTPDGRALVYAGDQSGGALNLWWRPLRGGRERRLTRGAGDYLAPRISRDGRRLVCEARTSVGSLRVLDLRRVLGGARPRVTGAGGEDAAPSSARTGRIAFSSARNGTHDIWTSDADGGDPRPLTSDPESDSLPAISPDGSRVAFVSDRGGRRGLWLVSAEGGPAIRWCPWTSWTGPPGRRTVGASSTRPRAQDAERRAVDRVRRRAARRSRSRASRGRSPAWSPAADLIAYFTSVGVGRAPDAVHDAAAANRAWTTSTCETATVDAAAFSWNGASARDRRLSGIGRRGGRASWISRAGRGAVCPAAALHGAARDRLDARRRAPRLRPRPAREPDPAVRRPRRPLEHRDLDAALAGDVDRPLVAGVDVAHDAGAGVGGEHALEAGRGLRRAVGDHHHAGVDRVAHADAAAVVDGDPGGAGHGVEERVQDRPVGHRVGAVAHGLGLAVGRGHRARVEVVAADDDRAPSPGRVRTSSLKTRPIFARSP